MANKNQGLSLFLVAVGVFLLIFGKSFGSFSPKFPNDLENPLGFVENLRSTSCGKKDPAAVEVQTNQPWRV